MDLKEFLNKNKISIDNGLFLVYGKAGVGKTTFLMELANLSNEKVFVIDSENGFSIDRFKQISGDNTKLGSLIVVKPRDFEEQAKIISNVLNNEKLFGFIGIDTIGKHYREPGRTNRDQSNNEIARQMRILKEISRKKIVVVCDQVYQNITENKVEPVGKNYVTKWCDYVIMLDNVNEKRILQIEKPKKEIFIFTITEKGFNFQ